MKLDIESDTIKFIGKILIILVLIYFVARQCTSHPAPQLPLPLVKAEKPHITNLVEYVTQTGTTVAYNSVDLVARVEGYLDAIEFTDGTFVKKDKELFVIQPEPYM